MDLPIEQADQDQIQRRQGRQGSEGPPEGRPVRHPRHGHAQQLHRPGGGQDHAQDLGPAGQLLRWKHEAADENDRDLDDVHVQGGLPGQCQQPGGQDRDRQEAPDGSQEGQQQIAGAADGKGRAVEQLGRQPGEQQGAQGQEGVSQDLAPEDGLKARRGHKDLRQGAGIPLPVQVPGGGKADAAPQAHEARAQDGVSCKIRLAGVAEHLIDQNGVEDGIGDEAEPEHGPDEGLLHLQQQGAAQDAEGLHTAPSTRRT